MTSRSSLATRPSLGALGVLAASIEDMLLESEGEVTPEIEQALAELDQHEGGKVDAYVAIAKALAGKAAGAKAELAVLAEPLERTRKAAENAIERLKARMAEYLEIRKVDKLQGTIYRTRMQANSACPALELLVPADQLPEPFRITTVLADTAKLLALLEGASKDARQEITAGMLWDTKTETDAAIVVAVRPPRGKHVRFE